MLLRRVDTAGTFTRNREEPIYIGGLVVINIDYLSAQLGHAAVATDYLTLAWLSASMGTIAGAVGSSLADAEVVRRATFSNREYERRQITVELQDDDAADDGTASDAEQPEP